MNNVIELHAAASKVIAAGKISDDWLRATVMLAPFYSPESAKDLARWPSQMISWLRTRNFRLRLLVQPVTYAGAGNSCVTLPKGEIQLIDAEASAMKGTWEGTGDTTWVDQLWAQAFDANNDPSKWSILAKTIAASASISNTSGAFAKSADGMAGSGKGRPTISGEKLGTEPVTGNNNTATLDWVLPSRQSDLSLLLEYKRALELCDSAVHAFDNHSAVLSKEIDCAVIAQRRPDDPEQVAPPLSLDELLASAHAQYQHAFKSAQSLYSEQPCEPQSARTTATNEPGVIAAANRSDLENALHGPLDSYQAANQPQQYANGGDNPYTTEDGLNQIFYSLQASPMLSRLFGLTIDVRLRRDSLERMLRDRPTLVDGSHFLYLALDDASLCRNAVACTIYTFAKYRPSSPLHFWPASRAEVTLGLSPDAEHLFDLAQYEGVMLGGRRLCTATGCVSRFELSSLDVRSACEAALDRRAVNLKAEELKQQCLSANPVQRPAAIARKTYSTAGIVVLDRGRQQQAVSQFAVRIAHQESMLSKPIVLDAEDLTIGYRIDVGVPLRGDQPNYAWRSLMARNMKYGITGLHAKRVRDVAKRLYLDFDRTITDADLSWRQCLEDGYLALPARLIPRQDSSGGIVVDGYVEEAIGCWSGEPMSVPCSGKRDEKVKPLYGLPSGCVVSAPTSKKDPQRRTPALRFGWPYRLGLRAVYSGSISVPLGVAANLYDFGRTPKFPLGGSLTIPAVPLVQEQAGAGAAAQPPAARSRDQLRRFLRHERIDAPFLLLPEEVALRRNGPMGYERAAHAVVRTAHGSVRERERPTVTQRVFVPPSVSQSLAAMHGVFDKTNDQHPAQGLSSPRFGRYGVRFDAGETGGFPIVTSDHIIGFNGVPYVSSRRISTNTKNDTGDLVYSTARGASRKTPYYPDPAISAYVIAIRVAGSSNHLAGGPCVISAYGNGYEYPNTRPLVVTVQRADATGQRSGYPRLESVLSWPKLGANGQISGHTTGANRIAGSVEARLTLAPGDDFELDIWCVPDEIGLAKRFAIIESIGSLAVARAKNKQSNGSFPTKEHICESLKELLPAVVCQIADKCLPDAEVAGGVLRDWSEGCAGPGGLPALGPESLRAIGRALYEALLQRPLDEIAAVRTLRATHATDQPRRAPEFAAPTLDKENIGPEPLLRLYRTKPSQIEPHRYSGRGNVLIHLPTTGSLEISADMASPSSDRFDDLRRSRALRDRRMGTWPMLADGSLMPPNRIFGFDVSPTGQVNLPKTRGVVLYRLDDIPLPQPEEPDGENQERHTIPLDKLFEIRGRDLKYGTGKPTFQFSDGLARSLDLQVTAYTRHPDQMRTASSPATNGRWLRDGEPLAPNVCSQQSSSVSVWLPAAVRPAEPIARTPVPAFLWATEREQKRGSEKIRRLSRRIVIRIPIDRPWFSSGEDERLGIVLWPPDLFTQDESRFAADIVESSSTSRSDKRLMNLENFQDEDLGPGGKFITRWGGDPTRTSAPRVPYRRTFIPASAFLDASQDTGTGFKAELITNVPMPIRVTENSAQRSSGEEGVSPTLEVSLLTFQPKFDVFEEQWYVDVVLEHEREAEPFVRFGLVRYQPHAPAHLQVSYPTTQWTQLLPRRTVEVRRSKTDVTIRVEGLATSPPPSTIKIDDEMPSVAKMTARIVREIDLDSGIPTQRIVSEVVFGKENITYLPASDDAYRAVWEQKLPLNTTIDKGARGRAKYFVTIEEREARLPATYVNEPVSPEMALGRGCDNQFLEEVLVESGPRFFAKIPL